MVVDDVDLKLLKNDLRACLLSKKNGISIARLLREFEDMTCESLDFRKFGSFSLEDFLRNKCSDVCRFGYDVKNPGIARIIAVSNEDTRHIEDMQRCTRPAKKASPPVRRRFAPNMRNPYMGQQRNMSYNTSDNRWSSSRFGDGQPNSANQHWRSENLPSRQPRSLMGQAPGYSQSRSLISPVPGFSQSRSSSLMGPTPGYSQSRPSSASQAGSAAKQPKIATSSATKPAAGTKTRSNPTASATKGKTTSESLIEIPKKPKKVTKSAWNIYGNYLLPILQKKKFGAMKRDVERDYEEKYKESLPDNWVDELENRLIMIANDYGDGILLLKALPQETIDKVNKQVKAQIVLPECESIGSSPLNRSFQEEDIDTEPLQSAISKHPTINQSTNSHAPRISSYPSINQPINSPAQRISKHPTINQSTNSPAPRISSYPTINQPINSPAQRISKHPTINQSTNSPAPRISSHPSINQSINSPTVPTINKSVKFQTPEEEYTKNISEMEMKSLEANEKLYESKSRYTGPQKISQRRVLRRPQLYELSNPVEYIPINVDQRVPNTQEDIYVMNESYEDNNTASGHGRATPTMEERFSKYRDNDEEIYRSDDSSLGSDIEWEDQPSFLKSPITSADCICERAKTLVFCSFCCFSVGDARVKTVCQVHRNKFQPFDLLLCPQCISEYIVELKETVY